MKIGCGRLKLQLKTSFVESSKFGFWVSESISVEFKIVLTSGMSSSMSDVIRTGFIGEDGGLISNLVGEEGREEGSDFGSEVRGLIRLLSVDFLENL